MFKSYVRLIKWSSSLSLFFLVGSVFISYFIFDTNPLDTNFPLFLNIQFILSFSGIIGFAVTAWVLLRKNGFAIEKSSNLQSSYLDAYPDPYVDFAIFLSAALSLFLELSLIRWQSSMFPFFAFYKNFALLSCFAGLGLGYALADRKSIPLSFVIPSLGWQIAVLMFLRNTLPRNVPTLWDIPFIEQGHAGVPNQPMHVHFIAVYFFLLVVFLLTAAAFIPVGQICGRLMGKREKLKAYGLNLLGSVFGVLLMFSVSFLWAPPAIWFCICFAAILAFQLFDIKALFVGVCCALMTLLILMLPVTNGEEEIYSPYQFVEVMPADDGHISVTSAGLYLQRIHDLSFSNSNRLTDPGVAHIANYYDLPYKLYGSPPGNIAIVGAGTGNDVAAALRNGASHIDAIEIDPAVLKLGILFHPEKPYHDPRVSAIVNDARTFMRTSKDQYDLVVYGLLDSHTVLSHGSSVRLDSFVYTMEGLQEAKERLREGGLLCLSYAVPSDEIGKKIYLMTEKVFGMPPVCIKADYDGSLIFLQKKGGTMTVPPDVLQSAGFRDVTLFFKNLDIKVDPSTDDWPFFYMPARTYPWSYLVILFFILIVSGLLIFNFFKQQPVFGHPALYFMGVGFMLIETKGITELGLTFGNTWQVIGVVISGILLMGFVANYCVQRFRLSKPVVPFILLFASLAIGYAISAYGGFPSSLWGKLGTATLLTCPMFFSGLAFSSLLDTSKNVSGAMAMNIMGAITGGILEYNSMYFGFRFLYLLAMAIYAFAFASSIIMRKR